MSISDRTPRKGEVWVNQYTNEETGESDPHAVCRVYLHGTIPEMVERWGKIDNALARERACDVIGELARRRSTEVFECFHLAGHAHGYLAFVFADNTEKGSCWLKKNYLDHLDRTEWCVESPKSGIWRTYLPGALSPGQIGGGDDWKVDKVQCERCPGVILSVTAECSCGWSPGDESVDYD